MALPPSHPRHSCGHYVAGAAHMACWCTALAVICITLAQHTLWILDSHLTQLGQFIALGAILAEAAGVTAIAYNMFMWSYGSRSSARVLPI
jgi:hypothetical protein